MLKDVVAEFGYYRNAITNTIKRWQQHGTLNSLLGSGALPLLD